MSKRRSRKDRIHPPITRHPAGMTSLILRASIIGLLTCFILVVLAFFFWPLPESDEVSGQVDQDMPTSTQVHVDRAWLTDVAFDPPQDFEFELVQKELQEAVETIAAAYPKDFRALHLAGLVFKELKQTEIASEWLRLSLEQQPDAVTVRHDLAELLMQGGRNDEALQIIEEATTGSVLKSDTSCLKAELQTRTGQLDDAMTTLQLGLAKFPGSATHWLLLGKLQLQLEKYAESEKSLRRSIELDSDSQQAWISLLQSLTLQNKRKEANDIRPTVEQLNSKNQAQRKSFEEVHRQSLGRFALSTFRSLAILYQDHQEFLLSKFFLDRSLQFDSRDIPSLGLLASHYRQQGQLEAAITTNVKLMAQQPDELTHYVNLASLCMQSSDIERAETALRLASERNIGNGQSELHLAKFLMAMNRESEAIPIARRALEKLESGDAYFVLLSALEMTGQSLEAERILSQAKKFDPSDTRFLQWKHVKP